MTSPRRTSVTLLALTTLALAVGGILPLESGAATKHTTTSSVLLATQTALLTETSVHVKVSTHTGTTTASVVADIGKTSGRETYGDTLIVDYWGNVVARLAQGAGVITAEFDPVRQSETRARFPALENRRLELPSDEAVPA